MGFSRKYQLKGPILLIILMKSLRLFICQTCHIQGHRVCLIFLLHLIYQGRPKKLSTTCQVTNHVMPSSKSLSTFGHGKLGQIRVVLYAKDSI